MDLDLSVEISALEHVFGPFQRGVDDLAKDRRLSVNLEPYTGDEDNVFVDMDVTFCMGPQYPDVAPGIEITSSRGLSDERISTVVQSMLAEAQQLAGEHMLMSMCMAGKEALSQLNHPEGACPFCLEDMQDASICMRGACFHGFHSSCFRRWWQWRVKQQELELQQYEENRRTIGLGVTVKEKEDIRHAPCPVCRASIPPAQLVAALLQTEHKQGYPDAAPVPGKPAPQDDPLDSGLVAFIESVAQAHRRIATEQQARHASTTKCRA
eukprot:jgi/Ulvmu1/4856/UM020_0142.1